MLIGVLSYRSLFCVLFLNIFIFPLVASSSLLATSTEANRTLQFQKLTEELVNSISLNFKRDEVCARLQNSEAEYRNYCSLGGRKAAVVIAIKPFEEDDIPLSANLADEFNLRLQQGLFKAARGAFTFVARQNIEEIIADKEAMGTLDGGHTNFIETLLKRNSKIDILIIGRINVKKNAAIISYDAQGMDGRKLATAVQRISLSSDELAGGAESLPSRIAVRRLALDIKRSLPDMVSVSLCGIKYQDTSSQPPFGLWITDQLSSQLDREYASILTGGRLTIDSTCTENKRNKPLLYARLGGRYWVFSDRIDVSLKLNGGSSVTASIKRTPDLPRIRPRGRSFDDFRRNDGVGPFKFELTTDRGRHPVYRIKKSPEKITLKFRVSKNASIYCFSVDKNLSVVQIFPNMFFNKSNFKNMVKYGKWHNIPDKKWTFNLLAEPPAGKDLIKCFAATRDIRRDLPRSLRGTSFDPIAGRTAQRLVEIFSRIPRVAISEQSILLTTVNE